MKEEFNLNTSIYNGIPADSPEQEMAKRAEQRALRASLPKFRLSEGEEFYIDKETIRALNKEYLELFDELKEGFSAAGEEAYSYMQSVVRAAYESEIIKRQREGKEKANPQKIIQQYKNRALQLGYVKDHWWQRRSHPNEALEQLIKLGNIEAAMEFAARAAEIERQKEFIDGDEPDAATEFFYLLADEFIPARKRKRFINRHSRRVMWLLSDYAWECTPEKLFELMLTELVADKGREKFINKNGEYLMYLLTAFLENQAAAEEPDEAAEEEEPEDGQTADDTEEPAEEAETEYDDLSALYELADEPDAEEPAAPEEVQEQPEQVAAAPTAPEEATPGEPEQGQIELAITSEPVEPVQELIPLSADEPVDSRNGDGGNGNE